MKTIRQKGDSYYDIEADEVFPYPIATIIVVVVLCAVVIGLNALITAADNASALTHNERAAEFNVLSLEERQMIAAWTEDDDIDPETYLMAEKDADVPLFLLTQIHGRGNVVRMIPVYLGALVLIFSLCVFVRYWYCKGSAYYLCSLPFGEPYGWVLFCCMFVGWPFLLISFVCLRVQQTEFFRERQKKRQAAHEARKREKEAVRQLAEEELAEAARRLTRPAFPERAHQALVTYIVDGQPKAHAARIQEATQRVEDAKSQLQKAGENVRVAQQKLGYARAGLEQLEATYSETHSHKKAESDWEAIKNARGVSSIVYNKMRKRLEILIKVRVPYDGELYDFGDYCFYIDGSAKCVCKEVRSGLKLNHSTTAPQYHIHGNLFCFGDSLSTINQYLRDGRYAEAVTLVVECMHSVNDSYTEREIPNCFRKVSVVEKAKQRILRRNKFITFWQRRVKCV